MKDNIMPKPNAVTPEQLFPILLSNWEVIHAEFKHIKPFTFGDVVDFLAGEPGAVIDEDRYSYGYTRSNQVKQAISAIGARLVDKKLADAETTAVYKALWAMESSCKCKYCTKPFKFAFMMGNNNGVCPKPRCTLQNMRDSI
jgi:hypothetical protein